MVQPSPKAHRAIERDLERLGSYIHSGLPRGAKLARWQSAESEQRNMQPLRRNQLAVKMVRALEHAGDLVNSFCRARVGNGREE